MVSTRPFVWQMIKQAVEALNGIVSYDEIKGYINEHWERVNQNTINAQIIAITVNHNSRIHYPENRKERLSNIGSPYDLLFTTDRGRVVKYDPQMHGTWEIYRNTDGNLKVKQINSLSDPLIHTPGDILWIKNITNNIDGQAYLDTVNDNFVVHFPTKHKSNVLSPHVGEIILLYQNINNIKYFTHLVTPIDNILVDDNLRLNYRYGRNVKIIAKTNLGTAIQVSQTLWDRLNFSGFSQGNACQIDHISKIGNANELRLDIWQRFVPYFYDAETKSVDVTVALLDEITITNPEETAIEGKLHLISHFVRERDRKIILKKKRQAIQDGLLSCQVCNFSFPVIYNATYIECHHLTPIGTGGVRETTLNDLALVCANCHRMLHTKFEGVYLSLSELKERIELLKPHS